MHFHRWSNWERVTSVTATPYLERTCSRCGDVQQKALVYYRAYRS